MKISYLTTAAMVAALGLSACSKTDAPPATETTTVAEGDAVPADTMAPSTNPMVGGAEMFPTKTIVDNAIASPIHKTLVAAVTQAGLVDTLKGAGPFTVFAPTDDAFAKVPKATLDGLMRPAQKSVLADVLKYHVVAGKLTAADLAAKITAGGGKAVLKTVNGQDLTATMAGNVITLTGADGSKATVTQADVNQSNGVIHVVDGVLTPKM
ncbi:fasciclin domain-containing protein [Sphingopyxis sp. OPL5]|uniref:fasciclin domain-containing protein n=1 Tax=unclassified Sphingopyxis TaxID=2614943 RepID=UPI0007011C09|nr:MULTISPECIES: fasciclin domain-containing protein [unclassified Sphingopyxis]KQZ61509.1 beta-Ig-H3/fasciclin [Sphingopyxis sp. Root1497]OHD02108.1 MAG: beta-Ig-H3/fasciclin [Sphingopyxis sp. RIFCSPHIGHO2_01_FULL_65_24]QNO27434.1 fasciclin domain-containing protein [Sphingopyxis sp. OPL5]